MDEEGKNDLKKFIDDYKLETVEREKCKEDDEQQVDDLANILQKIAEKIPVAKVKEDTVDEIKKLKQYLLDRRTPAMVIFGKPGSGKASLINAFFHGYVAEVNTADQPQISEPSWREYSNNKGSLKVLDTMSLFDNDKAGKEVLGQVRDLAKEQIVDIVLYVVEKAQSPKKTDEDGQTPLDKLCHLMETINKIYPTVCVIPIIRKCDEIAPAHVDLLTDDDVKRLNQHVKDSKEEIIQVHKTLRSKLTPDVEKSLKEKLVRLQHLPDQLEEWEAKKANIIQREKLIDKQLAKFTKRHKWLSVKRSIGVCTLMQWGDQDKGGNGVKKLLSDKTWNIDKVLDKIFEEIPKNTHLALARATWYQKNTAKSVAHTIIGLCAGIGSCNMQYAKNPIPFSNVVIVTPVPAIMTVCVAYISGKPFSSRCIVELLAAVGSETLSKTCSFQELCNALAKLIPVVDRPVSASRTFATTWAIGEIAIAFFIDNISDKTVLHKIFTDTFAFYKRLFRENRQR